VLLQNANHDDRRRSRDHAALLTRVGRVESITALDGGAEAPPSATALVGELRLLVPMKGLIDVDAERARLTKQQVKVRAELARAEGKLANANFVNNAPPTVVQQEKERAGDFGRQLEQLEEQLEKLASYA
jgi:valyl-tRNA synthetase